MKKLVSLLLALCMLMVCMPAFATLEIPETAADVPGAVKPVLPAYTLKVEADHYELIIDGATTDNCIVCLIGGYDSDGLINEVYLGWNDEGTALVSTELLDGAFANDNLLAFYIDKVDGSGYYYYNFNLETGKLSATAEGLYTADCNTWYTWNDESNRFTYQYTTQDGGNVYLAYNSVNGNLQYYSIDYSNGLSVSYNRYGKIIGGTYSADGGYYWDSSAKQWYSEATGEACDDLPALTLDEYPAPYAAPFVLNRPAAKLEDVDQNEGELLDAGDGTKIFWTDYVSAFYDKDGNLFQYSYSDLEGNRLVRYDVNDVLLFARFYQDNGCSYIYDAAVGGWFYDNGDEWVEIDESDLPEDVTVEDIKPVEDPDAEDSDEEDPEEEDSEPEVPKVKHTWYDHNTVGLVGLSLRDMGITDKWYNVVPVDLTQDGVQVLDLVGSNLFHIGKAAVIVKDGKVAVDYSLFNGHGYVKGECVQWFASLDDITTDFLNNPTSDLAFGQELSIADDLGGAETALLFICNRVTYRQPYNGDTGYLSRYWPNRQRWIDYRAELTDLLEGMSK